MNLRHAAGLALVGWYLMIPPSVAKDSWICGDSISAVFARNEFGWGKGCDVMALTADYDAPLSIWQQSGEPFERLAECEQARDQVRNQYLRDEHDYHKSNDHDPKQRPATQLGFATASPATTGALQEASAANMGLLPEDQGEEDNRPYSARLQKIIPEFLSTVERAHPQLIEAAEIDSHQFSSRGTPTPGI
jgi:hypothetical protein